MHETNEQAAKESQRNYGVVCESFAKDRTKVPVVSELSGLGRIV